MQTNSTTEPAQDVRHPIAYGATPEDWRHFADVLGLQADLLSVIADLSVAVAPRSTITIDGKTPSMINGHGLGHGFSGWQKRITTAREIVAWSADSRHSIGVIGRQVKAIDIDVDDIALADTIHEAISMTLGDLPCRSRANSGKRLLLFRMTEPMVKTTIEIKATARSIIEFLGESQQFLLAGTHKSGARYEWLDGQPTDIPTLTPSDIEALIEALTSAFGVPGGTTNGKAAYVQREPGATLGRGQSDDDEWNDLRGRWAEHERADGRLEGPCPWADLHSPGGAEFAMYIPAHYNGQGHAGFHCMHAHCKDRNIFDFRRAMRFPGCLPTDFEVVALSAERQADAAIIKARNADKAAQVVVDDFFAYAPDHKFIYRPTRQMWPAASVDGMVKPWPTVKAKDKDGELIDKPQAPSRWLDANRAVQQMTWLPGAPEVIRDQIVLESGFADRVGARVFNRYLPPPGFAGDASLAGPWVDHLKMLYPDDWSHLLHWFAHRLQRPGEKVNHAIVLGGAQGIGKDSILVPVKVGVGPANVQDIAPGNMLGTFNGFVAAVLLVVSEARDLGDTDRFKLYEHGKTLTAAPPEVLRVNEKGLREYYVPNLVGVIFTTNHRTSGLYLPAEDRRHYVAWSEMTSGHLDGDYFKRLYGWYASGGIGHVLAYLHALDLSQFNPKAEPRKTDAFWALVQAGESPESNDLRDAIKACGSPPALTVRMVRDAAISAGLGDLACQLQEPRERKRLPHMFERVGYVTVRNPDSKADGRFGKETVYAAAGLERSAQIEAARSIPRPAKAQSAAGSTASEFA